MKLLTTPQAEILSFLIKMGSVTVFALNRRVVDSLEQRGFVTLVNDAVAITDAGESFYKSEINAGRKALKEQLRGFKL